jgi:hypothetical protein
MGPRGGTPMGPGRQRGEIPGNLGWVPSPPGSQLRQNVNRIQGQTHKLEHLPPFPSREDLGGELGTPRLHVIPGCVLESKPQDVQPGPRGSKKLHMGWEGHQRQSESQMGYLSPPNHQGRATDHQPKDLVGSFPSKAPYQGPRTRRQTLEGAHEA